MKSKKRSIVRHFGNLNYLSNTVTEYIQKAQKNGVDLPQIELGYFFWRPSWNESLCFPIVVKRELLEQASLIDGSYKYYGVVTNHNLLYQTLQSLMGLFPVHGGMLSVIKIKDISQNPI